jgi:hypothetical protein
MIIALKNRLFAIDQFAEVDVLKKMSAAAS